jgi:ankyrin repeat protein
MWWWRRRNKLAALRKDRQEKFTAAVEEGRTANVWLILQQDKDLVHYKNHTSDKKKKKKKKKDEKDIDYRGETALHIATNNNDITTAAVLIQLGAKVNAENDKGETSLHLASKELNVDLVTMLLAKGASANERSNFGWTALHYVSFYAKMKRKKTQNGYKALTAPRKQNTSSGVALVHLLLDHGANVNSQTNTGWTPLVSENMFLVYDVHSFHFANKSLDRFSIEALGRAEGE